MEMDVLGNSLQNPASAGFSFFWGLGLDRWGLIPSPQPSPCVRTGDMVDTLFGHMVDTF